MLTSDDIERAIDLLESDVPPKCIASSLWLLIEELRDLADDISEKPEPSPVEQWKIDHAAAEATGQRNMFHQPAREPHDD